MSLDPIEEKIGKALEKMKPHELAKYVNTYQKEVNGIELSGNPQADFATMKAFQRDYGPEKAAAIIRDLFLRGEGRAKVSRREEMVTVRHFAKGLRWWTDKVDIRLQEATRADREVEEEFIFAEDL